MISKAGATPAATTDALYALRQRLIRRREALGITQQQLADLIGTRQSHVSDLENRGQDLRHSTLVRWAAALGLAIRVEVRDPWEGA